MGKNKGFISKEIKKVLERADKVNSKLIKTSFDLTQANNRLLVRLNENNFILCGNNREELYKNGQRHK